MKTIVAVLVAMVVLVPAAFATGQSLDPRVPALKRQINALNVRVNTVQAQVATKLDRSCVEVIPLVVRSGYVYQLTDGSLVIYKAIDEFDSRVDQSHNDIMQLKNGC